MSELRTPEPAVAVDQPLDIQHDPYPANDHGAARRIPHLGHVALLLGLMVFSAIIIGGIATVVVHEDPLLRESAPLGIGSEAAIYLLTAAAAFKVFPLFWKRSFLAGTEWNALAARRNLLRLLAAGPILCLLSEQLERFFSPPKVTELDKLLSTQSGAWAALLVGVFVAPACEEMVFRGFLLPAFATAYDWLSLERTPAGLDRWRNSTAHSTGAQLFGALLSSLLFGLLHAPQLHYAWGAASVLVCVGLVLAYIRLKLHSVAASTVVHMAYNGTLFAVMLAVSGGFRHLDRLQS